MDRLVRLEMRTTNVTCCHPVRLPFEQNLYSYCPTELADYFPPPVGPSRRARPGQVEAGVSDWPCPDHPDEVLVRLPLDGDLPVIVAVRLTLSFPGLIGAVPLFAGDRSGEAEAPVRCWFSTAASAATSPSTSSTSSGRYGRPMPSAWARTRGPPSCRRVPSRPGYFSGSSGARLQHPDRFRRRPPRRLQNCSDEGQATSPGFRHCIVEVYHTDEEGSMNLGVSRETSCRCALGSRAAVELRKFDFDRHRKVRYFTAMGQLDRAAREMRASYDRNLPGAVAGSRRFVTDVSTGNAVTVPTSC